MLRRSLLAFAALLALAGFKAPERYAVGQVWEYHTRPGDAGSLLKIQGIEPFGEAHVFHISVVGVHYGDDDSAKDVAHLPVSRETLDQSVTRLSAADATFPEPDEGIEIWRADNGGVFTISLAEIMKIIADTVPPPPA